MKKNMKDGTVTVTMSSDELSEYLAHKEAKELAAAQERAKAERQAYRQLSEEAVSQMMPLIKDIHERLKKAKTEVYCAFKTLIDTKSSLYEGAGSQRSHSFRSADGTARITIGYHHRDAWDDMVDVGVSKVQAYVSSLAKDEESATLVAMLLDLLAKDKQGNLQADKVLQLAKYADESGSEDFIDGVRIIQESYRPERTRLYVRAEERNAFGSWVTIPLGLTEVDDRTLLSTVKSNTANAAL